MTPERFAELAEKLKKHCFDTLIEKGKEYSKNDDRFHNFKAAARRRGIHPIGALLGMKLKHEVSIEDITGDAMANPGLIPDIERLLEKIGDDINYNILLFGLLVEYREAHHRVRLKRAANVTSVSVGYDTVEVEPGEYEEVRISPATKFSKTEGLVPPSHDVD